MGCNQQISTHWLRHTTLTWVERNFGYAIARAYADHADGGNIGTTATYVRASLPEVAAALAVLTGEAHLLVSAVVTVDAEPGNPSRRHARAPVRCLGQESLTEAAIVAPC